MTELGIAFGLMLVIEGVLYALFPDSVRRMMAYFLTEPPTTLRRAGLIAAFAGLGIVWLIKG